MKHIPDGKHNMPINSGPYTINSTVPPGWSYTVRGMTYTAPLPPGFQKTLIPFQDGTSVPSRDTGPVSNEPNNKGR
jgi:hypothetical protein